MLNRKEATIAGVLVGFVVLVAMPLFLVLMTMTDAIDVRLEAANPAGQMWPVLYFIGWLALMSGLTLMAAWAAHKAGTAVEAPVRKKVVPQVEAKPEVAAPLVRQPRAV